MTTKWKNKSDVSGFIWLFCHVKQMHTEWWKSTSIFKSNSMLLYNQKVYIHRWHCTEEKKK